ncbi:efflux RND transporter periplasmic adaptor subunit [Gloeobacter morelensis MG652769]|uniref:Efflux RND transporter periplasmic adaptor subunit n=2 Tax=Gloeobacter TaxID=33071 RepID=A0ABY3PU09_9CYAN|nr:efflux RND transporter periplasmic adaptor subunit [Gloeobacter morelensis MG652769]
MALQKLPKTVGRRRLALGLLLTLLAGAWLLWGVRAAQRPDPEGTGTSVAAVRRDIEITVSAAGVIKPLTPVNISPKQAGRLAALYVDQGARVRAGQILARMDDTNLRGQYLQAMGKLEAARASLAKLTAGNRPQEIAQAHENLQQAEADLISVRSNYQSNARLLAEGGIGRNSFEQSRSEYEAQQAKIRGLKQQLNLTRAGSRKEDIAAARAQVLQARGEVQTVEAQLNDTVIRAPFAGMITQKYASPGAFVTPTTSASSTTSATSSSILAMAGALEALVSVPESEIAAIRPDQAVELTVDAFAGRAFAGRVRLIAPEAVVSQNVTSFEVRVSVPGDGQSLLRSGMNLTARFRVARVQGALVVPTAAIADGPAGIGVLVADREGRGHFRPVEIGAALDTQTQIRSGLKAGERVLLSRPGRRAPNGEAPAGGPFGLSTPPPGAMPPR